MRTRSALAGLVVVALIGGLGVAPAGAQEGGTGDADGTGETTTTTTTPAVPAPPPADEQVGGGDGGGEPTDTAGDEPTATPTTTATTSPAETPGAGASPPAGGATDDPPATVSSQDATASSTSHAVADTGGNTATNATTQVIVADQTATAGGGSGGAAPSGTGAAANTTDGSNSGVGIALVVTGDASATGGATDDAISQKALVKAIGTGEIEIIQIALIVNLGVGVANTGGNQATGLDVVNVIGIDQSAGAAGGAGGIATNGLTAANDASGHGMIATGDATAVGNANDVRVTQAADVAAGTGVVASDQTTDVRSLGIAYGNTGLNLVIGNAVLQIVLVDQSAAGGAAGSTASATNAATAGNIATGLAAITTGSAGAVGNASSTGIEQLAVADAGDGGFVSILQRALVLNLGIALANSGMNTATGNQSLNIVDVQQQSIAGAFWASLQSLFGGAGWLGLPGESSNAVSASNTSDGAALVTTGDASATGLASTTRVGQQATGSAAGGGRALVTQEATVTNGGLAIANTGGNDAAGLLALNAVIAGQWAGLGDFLAGYLDQLGTGATTASPATSSWTLGDVLVDLFGEIHADDVLIDGFGALSGGQVEAAIAQALGFADGFDGIASTGPGGGPRIRVRQVTGTLTINLGIASTGGNTAETATVNVTVVDQESQAASETQVTSALGRGLRAALQTVAEGTVTGDAALDPANLAVLINATTGAAVVVTGDATAANRTVVAVCQTFETSTAICDPPGPGPAPSPAPGTVPSGTIDTGTSFTPPAPGARVPVVAGTAADRYAVPATARPVQAAGDLPRTGTEAATLVRVATALLAAGVVLCTAARGRRRLAAAPLRRPR